MICLLSTICVIGLGYIGLPTASLLASKGYKVHGVDVKTEVIEILKRGEIHLHEPDLDVLVKSAINSGNLTVSLKPVQADVFIIAVPTPLGANNSPDLTYIEAAINLIAEVVRAGNLIILESTSPVGTTEKVGEWIKRARPDLQIGENNQTSLAPVYIAHCPERVLPGQILKELIVNNRIVGGIDEISARIAAEFYGQFVTGTVMTTNARTAELVKLTENTFRDVNIGFANELSLICDELNINVWDVIGLANQHPRVNILEPGPGVGGHCIAVDPWFIVDGAPEKSKLIRIARSVNLEKTEYTYFSIISKAKRFKNPVIACLGLSFKANVDDVRESPALEIVRRLAELEDAKLLVVEPNLNELPAELFNRSNVIKVDLDEAVHKADIVALLVNHKSFYTIGRSTLAQKIVIDTRGVWR